MNISTELKQAFDRAGDEPVRAGGTGEDFWVPLVAPDQ